MSGHKAAKVFPHLRYRPDVAFGTGATRVLCAVLHGTTTHDGIMARTGLSRQRVNHYLRTLRDAGLVDFVDGHKGTLHATCVPVRPTP